MPEDQAIGIVSWDNFWSYRWLSMIEIKSGAICFFVFLFIYAWVLLLSSLHILAYRFLKEFRFGCRFSFIFSTASCHVLYTGKVLHWRGDGGPERFVSFFLDICNTSWDLPVL